MALPSAAMNAIRPTVMRMCPRPAMPEIIAEDSSPSTVKHPCPIMTPAVTITPTLYSQKKRIELTATA